MFRRSLAILAIVALLVLTVASPAAAGRRWDKTPDTPAPTIEPNGCTPSRITLYENPNYGSDGGTIPLVKCANDSYLGDDLAVPGDGCSAPLLDRGDWNDCVSSWKFVAPAATGGCQHYGVNLWQNSNYNSILWSHWGSANFPGGFGFEDVLSSISFKYRSVCPTIAEQQPS